MVGIWGFGCLNRRAEHGSTHGGLEPDTAASAAAAYLIYRGPH